MTTNFDKPSLIDIANENKQLFLLLIAVILLVTACAPSSTSSTREQSANNACKAIPNGSWVLEQLRVRLNISESDTDGLVKLFENNNITILSNGTESASLTLSSLPNSVSSGDQLCIRPKNGTGVEAITIPIEPNPEIQSTVDIEASWKQALNPEALRIAATSLCELHNADPLQNWKSDYQYTKPDGSTGIVKLSIYPMNEMYWITFLGVGLDTDRERDVTLPCNDVINGNRNFQFPQMVIREEFRNNQTSLKKSGQLIQNRNPFIVSPAKIRSETNIRTVTAARAAQNRALNSIPKRNRARV
jgi:hypothetical protein